MRKNATKLAAVALSLALTVTSVNVASNSVSAAKAKKTTVKLNKTTATLKVGKKTTLKVRVKKKGTTKFKTVAAKKVTFKSSKKAVATVTAKGVVKAKKAGKATITATYNEKTYTCKVTVKKAAATEAPATEAPATEAPATEAPATEAPATEAPATEAPATLGKITELKATSASALQATFDAELPTDAVITVTKGSVEVSGKVAVDESKKVVTFTGDANLTAGTYTLTATLGEAKESKDVDVKDSYVAEIKVLNEVALTGKKTAASVDGSAAYIYYDVLNQYGESVRTSENIEWTTAPNDKTVDKSLGKITVTKDDGFTYGSQIYITGVHVKSGQSYSGSVTVGMAQAVNSVEFAGFLSTDDKTKKLENLPANFKKDTYYLLYKTADQNGNALDVNDSEFTYGNITFICDAPLVLDIDATAANQKVFTVDGEEYAAIPVNPGQYADKGGEVNITAISNKTGVKTTQNYVIGAAGVLKSLTLSSPASIVADGDSKVKIPYTAYDTDGNAVTNYETIVRSSNSLSLSASDNTTLVVKEENDGTAGIYWSDSATYNPKTAATYGESDVCNDVSRNISLTTVVVGGESSNMMMEVSDIRRPNAIKSVVLNDDKNDVIASGATTALDISGTTNGDGDWSTEFTYIDQYGAELDGEKATAFFAWTKSNEFGKGTEKGTYGIKVETTDDNHLGLASEKVYKDGKYISITASATGSAIDTVKYSIVRGSDAKGYDDVSKVKSVNYTIVPTDKIKNYTISGLDTCQALVTKYSSVANGKGITESENDPVPAVSLDANSNKWTGSGYTVTGTYDGKTVTLPESSYEVSDSSEVSATGDTMTGVTAGALVWSDLYDFGAYANPRKNATVDFVVNVLDATGAPKEPLTKTITVSDAEAKAVGLTFNVGYWDGVEDATYSANNTAITIRNAANGGTTDDQGLVSIGGDMYKGGVWLYALDQYGRQITTDILYTVSDIKENEGEFAHKKDNFVVNQNGTATASIEGAEIGDTFKLTAKVKGTTITDVLNITVTADKMAYISNAGNTADTALCTTLGINK